MRIPRTAAPAPPVPRASRAAANHKIRDRSATAAADDFERGEGSGDIGPLGEPGAPPRIVLGCGMKLRQVIGDHLQVGILGRRCWNSGVSWPYSENRMPASSQIRPKRRSIAWHRVPSIGAGSGSKSSAATSRFGKCAQQKRPDPEYRSPWKTCGVQLPEIFPVGAAIPRAFCSVPAQRSGPS